MSKISRFKVSDKAVGLAAGFVIFMLVLNMVIGYTEPVNNDWLAVLGLSIYMRLLN